MTRLVAVPKPAWPTHARAITPHTQSRGRLFCSPTHMQCIGCNRRSLYINRKNSLHDFSMVTCLKKKNVMLPPEPLVACERFHYSHRSSAVSQRSCNLGNKEITDDIRDYASTYHGARILHPRTPYHPYLLGLSGRQNAQQKDSTSLSTAPADLCSSQRESPGLALPEQTS